MFWAKSGYSVTFLPLLLLNRFHRPPSIRRQQPCPPVPQIPTAAKAPARVGAELGGQLARITIPTGLGIQLPASYMRVLAM